MTTKIIKSPYQPRPLQADLHKDLRKYNVVVAHRRFGKTYFCINEMIFRALQCQKNRPQYAYVAPEKAQAKKIVWGIMKDNTGFLPDVKYNEAELKVEFTTAGGTKCTIYVEGADDPARLRGMYFDGVVLDEVAQMPEEIWDKVLMPALTDRDGWAIFIGTPEGKNLLYRLYQRGLKEDARNWYSHLFKASETGIFTHEQLKDFRDEIGDEAYNQEYECSFDAAVKGTYYGKNLAMLKEQGFVGNYPWDPSLPVFTAWDIGGNDPTAIWFAQQEGDTVRIIDFYQGQGPDVSYYINIVLAKPYKYKKHIFPHDMHQNHWGQGKTRLEQVRGGLGTHHIQVLKRTPVIDGITAVRSLLPRCRFNAPVVDTGLDALFLYRSDYNSTTGVYNQQPKHDWTSHAADSFRYLALGLRELPKDLFDEFGVSKQYSSYDDYNPLD